MYRLSYLIRGLYNCNQHEFYLFLVVISSGLAYVVNLSFLQHIRWPSLCLKSLSLRFMYLFKQICQRLNSYSLFNDQHLLSQRLKKLTIDAKQLSIPVRQLSLQVKQLSIHLKQLCLHNIHSQDYKVYGHQNSVQSNIYIYIYIYIYKALLRYNRQQINIINI